MKGHIPFKHVLKRLAGVVASCSRWGGRRVEQGRVLVLMYHRVSMPHCLDWSTDDWNISPRRFRRQMLWLSQHAECLRVDEVQSRMGQPAGDKPLVAVTFDDGFANFATQALPILEEYRIPATVFLVTSFVGQAWPYPFDGWAHRNLARTHAESWKPITWEQVERCVTSGLVTFGSHSASHPDPNGLRAGDLENEAEHSRSILRSRLGEEHSASFAYPYGSTKLGEVTDLYVEAVRGAGYRRAFTTDLGLWRSQTGVFTIPRVEAHRWDTPAILDAKLNGVLWPYRVTDSLRSGRRLHSENAAPPHFLSVGDSSQNCTSTTLTHR